MTVFMEKFHARIFIRSSFLYLRKNIHITEKMFITLAPGAEYPDAEIFLGRNLFFWSNFLTPNFHWPYWKLKFCLYIIYFGQYIFCLHLFRPKEVNQRPSFQASQFKIQF